MKINYNGNIIGEEDTIFTINNRAFKYGDGVFDTCKYSYDKVLFWEEHYLRLMAGMRVLRMQIPMVFSMEYLEEEILTLIKANELEHKAVRVRISVFRKDGGKYTPLSNEIDYVIEVQALSAPFYVLDESAYEVELFKDFFVQADLLANIKHTNRTINILGSIFAEENDYQNCLLLNSNKNIAGALNGNLFMVNGRTLKTPPLSDGALNGITRKVLMKTLAKTQDYEVIEASISPFELQKADELFITNSIVGIQPIRQYRKKSYTYEVAKSLIGKLNTSARFGVS
nr:aminotransferase class IV [uncultured Capnocytophaga sp.]